MNSILPPRLVWKRRLLRLLRGKPDSYLRSCRGVIHVGANIGQERDLYASLNLKVVWIEPIPAVYEKLCRNIAGYSNQMAIRALIADREGINLSLHIANNDGASSSILEPSPLLNDIWPEIDFIDKKIMRCTTLPNALADYHVDLSQFDALVMDTQGSELVVLRGAEALLSHFNYIFTEAADFELYKGCPTGHQISEYLAAHGFRKKLTDEFARRDQVGSCFNLLFERIN
jgi:FkbM family methyltransferase